jgi:hypothetical protein
LLGRIVEGGAQHPRAEGPQRLDCQLGVAGIADDSEDGGMAWLERLADLAQEPLVEPEGGQFRPYGPRGGADNSKQHRLNQQQPQHSTDCGSAGGAGGYQAHRLHQLDPAVLAAAGQRSPIQLERSFAIELGAAGTRLLRQLPAVEAQHHQLLHALSLPFPIRVVAVAWPARAISDSSCRCPEVELRRQRPDLSEVSGSCSRLAAPSTPPQQVQRRPASLPWRCHRTRRPGDGTCH